MSSFRLERVGNIISHEISSLIVSGKIKDPRVGSFITVTHVEVSKDLTHAKIWVSCFDGRDKTISAVEGLSSASGFIQSILGQKLKTRYTPKLQFKADHSIEESIRIQKKISEISTDNDK